MWYATWPCLWLDMEGRECDQWAYVAMGAVMLPKHQASMAICVNIVLHMFYEAGYLVCWFWEW